MLITIQSLTFILVVILAAILIAMYYYSTQNFKFWQALGIPYLKPTPFVGNLKDCVFQKTNIGGKLQQIYKENSEKPYVGIFSFHKPSLVICDLELVKNILVKDSQNFMDRVANVDEMVDPMLSKTLFMSKGQRSRHLRSNLNPVFTSGKIKRMFYLVDTCGKELADCLDRATVGGSTVDVVDIMHRYTTDVIASCAFGIDGHCLTDRNAEFWGFVKRMLKFSVKKGLAGLAIFCAPALAAIFKLQLFDDDMINYLTKTVWSTVEYREKNGIVRNDFLDCMMKLRKKGKRDFQQGRLHTDSSTKDDTFQIDDEDLVSQSIGFIGAAYETTGSTLSFALYEIALHPEIQHRLRTEILSVLNRYNGQLTYGGIKELSYLDMVVSETLRKYPPVPFLDRMCCSDYELPAPTGRGMVMLPAGTAVYIPVMGFHHDPKYFTEPEKFDPDRFTEENKQTRPNYTYMPFGEGPRMCIGMRFGLMEVKTALCHILSRFEVTPCKDTPVPIAFDLKSFLLTSKEDIPLFFKLIPN